VLFSARVIFLTSKSCRVQVYASIQDMLIECSGVEGAAVLGLSSEAGLAGSRNQLGDHGIDVMSLPVERCSATLSRNPPHHRGVAYTHHGASVIGRGPPALWRHHNCQSIVAGLLRSFQTECVGSLA